MKKSSKKHRAGKPSRPKAKPVLPVFNKDTVLQRLNGDGKYAVCQYGDGAEFVAPSTVQKLVGAENLQEIGHYDREWWKNFSWDFEDYQVMSGDVINDVTITLGKQIEPRVDWVRLVFQDHIVVASSYGDVTDDDDEFPVSVLYASSEKAVELIQNRAGYPKSDWFDHEEAAAWTESFISTRH